MKHTIIDAHDLELNDKVVSIKRVTKVVKGGRHFRFAALVVVGDGNGHVGAGIGKAMEIPEAIRKGKEDAMKRLVSVPVDENGSIPHDMIGKFGSSSVLLKKAPEGTGVIAGGPARSVIEMAGITNIRTKSWVIEPFSSLATVTNFFIASSFPLRIASGISAALPKPAPTCPLPSPTTTKAVKRKLRPPLTTFVTRLIDTTLSSNSN